MAEVAECRERAEMELRLVRRFGGTQDLESLDRRLGVVEFKLDLILRRLPQDGKPRP